MEDEQHSTKEANKICGVCGDRALGFNFNAVSCESCKAFFRRNALKNKEFQCPFTENCIITPVTRRFCQKCRLDKCFSIGMKKEYIMTEEDKIVKRHKIEQNRAKKRPPSANPKVAKTKREVVDDQTSLDNDTLAPNASPLADLYSWDSDGKHIDWDNRRTATETMSPSTEPMSVPSPPSPAEIGDTATSKTTEMVEYQGCIVDAVDNVDVSCTIKFEPTRARHIDVNDTKCLSAAVRRSECHANVDGSTIYTENITDNFGELNCQEKNESGIVTENMEERCRKSTELILRFVQDPNLVAKIFTNPSFVSKLFEDKSLMTKIMTDPRTVTRLASDPQLSKFIEENDESVGIIDRPLSHGVSSNTSNSEKELTKELTDPVMVLDNEPIPIGNPILTNLITQKYFDSSYDIKVEGSSNLINSLETTAKAPTTQGVQDVTIKSSAVSENSIESILSKAIKLEYSGYSALGGNQTSRELNDAERAKLNELIVANKALLAPLDDDITNLVGDECMFKGNGGHSDPMLLDVINLTAIAIRRLIKMSKKINAFKNMCQEDQLALLKGGCTEMLILRSALNYDPDKEIWKIPHSLERMSNIKVDVLKEAKGNLYEAHSRFVRTFDPRWRDENIILILSAIALFSPERPRVVHRDVIKLEQNSYYYLLRRYLESVYPGCEAKSTFLKLIQKISELHSLNDEVVGVYLNVNPSSVEPLLIEIFDLKQ